MPRATLEVLKGCLLYGHFRGSFRAATRTQALAHVRLFACVCGYMSVCMCMFVCVCVARLCGYASALCGRCGGPAGPGGVYSSAGCASSACVVALGATRRVCARVGRRELDEPHG